MLVKGADMPDQAGMPEEKTSATSVLVRLAKEAGRIPQALTRRRFRTSNPEEHPRSSEQ